MAPSATVTFVTQYLGEAKVDEVLVMHLISEFKRRGNKEDEEYRDDDDATMTTAANTTTIVEQSAEDLRRIEEESIPSHKTLCLVKALISRNAELERDADHRRTAHAKRKENEGMLEEMTEENKQLPARLLGATESEMNLRLQEAKSLAEGEAGEFATKYAIAATEKDVLDEKLRLARAEIASLQQIKTLDDDIVTLLQHKGSLETNMIASNIELTKQLQALTNRLKSTNAALCAKDEYCEQLEASQRHLRAENRALAEQRVLLHNRVIQHGGNIREFVRVRPIVESERRLTLEGQQIARYNRADDAGDDFCPFCFPSIPNRDTRPGFVGAKSSSNYTSCKDLTKQVIEVTEPPKDRGGLRNRPRKHTFGFDRVFSQDHGQDDVWKGAEPLVQSCIDGFQVSMIAYGQSGSGKTHTMIGVDGDRGLIPRAVKRLFEAKGEIERGGQEVVKISVEMLEIYNEKVRDLLGHNAGPDGQLVKPKLSSNEAVRNIKMIAQNEQHVKGILNRALDRRSVGATNVNAESSRSHLLFRIHFNGSSMDDANVSARSGCLHIVDLAGTESLDKSGSVGERLTEAKHINQSLSALRLVIQSLLEKQKNGSDEHISYRTSVLTSLLINSLEGDSKTLFIVCCSPHQTHVNESLHSLRFADMASNVQLKKANTVAV